MSRYIDADAYAAEMKPKQDACWEWIQATEAKQDELMYERASGTYTAFTEAKLTLDTMPTVDAVPVVRCAKCEYYDEKCGTCGRTDIIRSDMRIIMPDWYCGDGKRKENG